MSNIIKEYSVLLPWQARLQWPLLTCVFLFGATAMTMKGGANIFLFLMTLLSLPLLKGSRGDHWSWGLFAVLSASFVITLLQLAAHMRGVKVNTLDAPSRFFLAAICLFALQRLPAQRLALACWGVWLGAIGVMVWGYVSLHVPAYYWGGGVRAWNQFSNPIAFGVLSVVLGCLCLVLPMPPQCQSALWIVRLLKGMGFVASLIAAYYSTSRAPFVILPVVLLIPILAFTRQPVGRVLLTVIGVSVVAGILVMSVPNRLHERISEGYNDIQVLQQTQNTSLGLRLVMWKVATEVIADHPWIGVGKGGYFNEVNRRIRAGTAPVIIKTAPHPHNELLNFGIEMGLPGIVLGLLLFGLPAALFLPAIRHPDPWIRFAAAAGSIVVVGQIAGGLFDTYFWIVSQTAFYGVFVVVFAATLLARRQALRQQSLCV